MELLELETLLLGKPLIRQIVDYTGMKRLLFGKIDIATFERSSMDDGESNAQFETQFGYRDTLV